ncbi:hypothetical protein D3C81_1402880 [compost metagenome]
MIIPSLTESDHIAINRKSAYLRLIVCFEILHCPTVGIELIFHCSGHNINCFVRSFQKVIDHPRIKSIMQKSRISRSPDQQ